MTISSQKFYTAFLGISYLCAILLLIMKVNDIEEIWGSGEVLPLAFREYLLCLEDVYRKACGYLSSPQDSPQEFKIEAGDLPREFLGLSRNIFSSLFQSVYHILEISEARRMLYGKMNHLFRVWVTSADNLLDGEDKVVIPVRMQRNSRIMRQVLSLMAADRILAQLLDEAREQGVISAHQARLLLQASLEILLPSAAEEASEEGGIEHRPEPEYVLYTIHRLKTGLLFHIPFLGPERIEEGIDVSRLHKCKYALDKFALGCQLLDDIRDIAKDYLEKRHNYVLSRMCWEGKSGYLGLLGQLKERLTTESNIFLSFPEVVYPAAELAIELLTDGLRTMDGCGLGIGDDAARAMAFSMGKVLGVEEAFEGIGVKESLAL